MSKIVIAGGIGFLGTGLINYYLKPDSQLIILTRRKTRTDGNVQYMNWDGKTVGLWADGLESADLVINLNGKLVDCRYTDKNKALIYSTRLDSTTALGKAIQQCKVPPKLWINSASATIC
jgi:NAD dependent epimerase/dehydratase family enzyme